MILSRIRGLFVLIQFSITVAFVIAAMYTFRNHTHKIIKAWMKLQVFLLGIKIEVQGVRDESCDMYFMNHQSLLDIIVIEHLHNKDLAWVAKKEISELFFFGHIIKAPRMISIDRENKVGIINLLKDVKDRLDKGRPIAMFPEGTRGDGSKMLKFKSGGSMIANKLALRVQPLVILNTRDILDSKKLLQNPGVVKVIYLDPVQADKKTDWFKEVEAEMQATFEKEKKQI